MSQTSEMNAEFFGFKILLQDNQVSAVLFNSHSRMIYLTPKQYLDTQKTIENNIRSIASNDGMLLQSHEVRGNNSGEREDQLHHNRKYRIEWMFGNEILFRWTFGV